MLNNKFYILGIIITGIISVTSFATSEELKNCATSECHQSMASQEEKHPKGKNCVFCHKEKNDNPHPGSTGNEFNLSDDPCLECHDKVVAYNHLHPPVAAGDCLFCHSAHDNGLPNFLKKQNQQICYDCHNPVVKPEDTVLHGEISEGKCNSCHTEHGSFAPNLLRDQYSKEFFNDYNERHYKLCFRCHKIDLLLHPRTSYNTNFRDGKKNLHFLHVNRDNNGKSCKLCHEIHAGRLPKLMAKTVTFGSWQMPVNFKITENGGRCAPGCHAPKNYSR